MDAKKHAKHSRWVSEDLRVWERTDWGWKFIGIAKSLHTLHVMELIYSDWDHPYDIYDEPPQGDVHIEVIYNG